MQIYNNGREVRTAAYIMLLAAIFVVFYLGSAQAQYNYDHVNVTTQVNITNAKPEIINITIDSNITLNAGGTKTVSCNITVRDYNGYNDINFTNATFYHYLNLSTHADDNNYHYTNTSCNQTGNDGQYEANYSCSFPVNYFANNGSWSCNASVIDMYGFTDSENNITDISPLYALNVTDVIDYGNLSVTDYSQNISANITNFGNMDINVSILGYGSVEGDGWALICPLGDNITVENERYYASLQEWSIKTQLSGSNVDLNTTLLQQTNDVTAVLRETFWQLYVPPNPFGFCTGVVRFTATTP